MKKVILLTGDTMGKGDDKLGATLMNAFLHKVWALDKKPDAVILYNGGVKLAATGSPVLDVLDGLTQAGVDVLACGTCVEFFGLKDKMQGARVSNMEEIVKVMMSADDTVTV